VVIERNRGAIVRSLSPKDIEDLYELRAKLESLAAERAARRSTPADLAEMDAAISEFNEALLDDSVSDVKRLRALSAANQRFHGTILRVADHSSLSQMLARTVDIPLVFQSFQNFDRAERERSNLFHQLVRGAIAAGNPERAGQLMSEHILLARDALARRFQREGELANGPAAGGSRARLDGPAREQQVSDLGLVGESGLRPGGGDLTAGEHVDVIGESDGPPDVLLD
jgi:DNA-binding GntR family transcriptional regulator